MRIGFFSLLVLINICTSLGQDTFYSRDTVYSANKSYQLVISGYYNETYIGDQNLTLLNIDGDTLWSIVLPEDSVTRPRISNVGEVVIAGEYFVRFYGLDEKVRGEYLLDHQREYFGSSENGKYIFSPTGDRFYILGIFPRARADFFIICFDNNGKQVWRDTLDYRGSFHFQVYKDILYVFCTIADESVKHCAYLFHKDDARIWQYVNKFNYGWKAPLDDKTGILNVIDGPERITIELDSLCAP